MILKSNYKNMWSASHIILKNSNKWTLKTRLIIILINKF